MLWLTLSGSNYTCLEQISMVLKCSSHWSSTVIECTYLFSILRSLIKCTRVIGLLAQILGVNTVFLFCISVCLVLILHLSAIIEPTPMIMLELEQDNTIQSPAGSGAISYAEPAVVRTRQNHSTSHNQSQSNTRQTAKPLLALKSEPSSEVEL